MTHGGMQVTSTVPGPAHSPSQPPSYNTGRVDLSLGTKLRDGMPVPPLTGTPLSLTKFLVALPPLVLAWEPLTWVVSCIGPHAQKHPTLMA